MWKARHADGGARVLASLAEHFHHQFRYFD
jgi:hypothetical protein